MTDKTQMTARDLLVRLEEYPHAQESQTLAEAVELLETWQIEFGGSTSMPRVLLVLDDNNQLLGTVRRRDILRGIEPEFHGELDTTHPEAHFLSLIHISEPTRPNAPSRMPSSA